MTALAYILILSAALAGFVVGCAVRASSITPSAPADDGDEGTKARMRGGAL